MRKRSVRFVPGYHVNLLLLRISDHLRQKTQSESFRKDSEGFRRAKRLTVEPRAKTNENPTSSETLSCFCCKLIQFDKLCDSFRKSKTLWVFSKDSSRLKWSEICSIYFFNWLNLKCHTVWWTDQCPQRQQCKQDSFESCAPTKPREQGFVWF